MQGLRGREGLTQAEFAEKLGVRQNCISDMERNVRLISKGMAKKIGETFDIDYTLFLFWNGESVKDSVEIQNLII